MVKEITKFKKQRSNKHRSIKDWPESERPREKLLQLRPEGLSGLPQSFDHAADVVVYVRPHFEGKRQECFLTILLDGQNQLLAERWIAEDIPTQATVYIRRVMEEALRVSASAFVVAYNHPSGQPKPSAADDQTTQDLKHAADIMNLIFLDHIIVGNQNSYYSYTETGRSSAQMRRYFCMMPSMWASLQPASRMYVNCTLTKNWDYRRSSSRKPRLWCNIRSFPNSGRSSALYGCFNGHHL
jgi:hypothetical protein